MVGVGGFSDDVVSSGQRAFMCNVLDGTKRNHNYLPHYSHHSLQGLREWWGKSETLHIPKQAEMQLVSMLSIMRIESGRIWRGRWALLIWCKKSKGCWSLFTCTPKNLVMLTTFIALLLTRSGVWQCWFLLKSTMIFSVFWHSEPSCLYNTSSLVGSPSLCRHIIVAWMRPTAVV